MKRYKHSLSNKHLTTFDMGQIIPVQAIPVLAGDTIQSATSALVRITPQLKPLMHSVRVIVHNWFYPNRLAWSGWEDFITGTDVATAPPTISGQAYAEGTLQDYIGIYDDASNDYDAMVVRAYNNVYNHAYRDQDLVSEVSEDQLTILNAPWNQDYLTSARPWAQKGTQVTLPIGTEAPIVFGNNIVGTDYEDEAVRYRASTGSVEWKADSSGLLSGAAADEGYLKADLTNALGIDVDTFLETMATHKYQQARARYGSRHVDYLRYLGIRPRDGRLDIPEYLGGGRSTIAFSEVLDAGAGTLGDMGGHGITQVRSNRFKKYFDEHGWMLTLMMIVPESIYVDNIPRKFSKTTYEEYWQKEFEHIGQQEILNKEVYAGHTNPTGVWGYGDRYREYTEEPNRVSAEMRNSTNYDFHMGRILGTDTPLNGTFITCNPTKRCFADQTEDSCWVMVNNSVQARRFVKPPASRRRQK